MCIYVTGLRNHHAVETQAIGTNQLSYMEAYPELHACRKADKARSERQAARLDDVLATHDTAKSLAKEAAVRGRRHHRGFRSRCCRRRRQQERARRDRLQGL